MLSVCDSTNLLYPLFRTVGTDTTDALGTVETAMSNFPDTPNLQRKRQLVPK